MMIQPAPTSLIAAVGDAPRRTMTSSIAANGMRQVISMLSNLYSEPILAVVRELLANAVDASREAGSTRPVEVTSPTTLEPYLTVTDHGTGMTMDGLEQTFLTFAASTKRGSNDHIGGLGIGAKSPWAVSETFVIDTVKDGLRTTVRASIELEHEVLVAGEATDLPNGTTIIVPVSNPSSSRWSRAIREVTAAHEPGTVKLDGKPVESIASGVRRIGPVITRQGREDERVTIRSGGTFFEVPWSLANHVRETIKLKHFTIDLPIGSFDHAPSRESVIDNERTRTTVSAALAEYKTAYDATQARIEALAKTDITAALKLRADIVGDQGDYTVLPLGLNLRVPASAGAWLGGKKWVRTTDAGSDGMDIFSATAFTSNEAHRTFLVTDVPADKKLRTFATFMKNHHSSARRVIPIPAGRTSVELEVREKDVPITQTFILDTSMVPEGNVYTWDEWLKVTASPRGGRASYATGARTTAYDVRFTAQDGDGPTNVEWTAKEIAAKSAELGLPVWYVEGDLDSYRAEPKRAGIGIILGRRKLETLLRFAPAAMSVHAWHRFCYEGINQWPLGVRLALVARTDSSALPRFEIVAEADEIFQASQVGSAVQTVRPLARQAAGMVSAIAALTDAQIATWDEMRKSYYRVNAEPLQGHIDLLEKALNRAWPLLDNSYNLKNKRSAYIEYVAAVAPRQCDAIKPPTI